MRKVTVLMAVYNGERHIGETISSVLSQTFEAFEFLIVNDASTDRTREIILSFADPRIRLVENERNLGLARSLNRGLRLAKGELIARQDADDLSEPQRLERQVDFLHAHPEVALVGTWYTEIDAHGALLGQHELPCEYTPIRWSLLFVCPFVHSAVMLRKSLLLDRIGWYNESLAYSLDYELWNRIARHHAVANLAEHLVRLRVHRDSMTMTFGERIQEGHRLRVANVARLLGWRVDDASRNEARYQAMNAVLRGNGGEPAPDRIPQALDNLLLLHRAFCADNDLAPQECVAHRAVMAGHVAWQLLALSNRYRSDGDRRAAQRTFVRACRLRPQILLQPSTWRLGVELLLPRRVGVLAQGISRSREN